MSNQNEDLKCGICCKQYNNTDVKKQKIKICGHFNC